MYFYVCHGIAISESDLRHETIKLGQRFGYRAAVPTDEQLHINHPEDLVN
jgi:hypothetical protein